MSGRLPHLLHDDRSNLRGTSNKRCLSPTDATTCDERCHHDSVELRDLRYFAALAEELNFTRAAARCWVSQQALSQSIAALERRLGTPLVVRRPRGCSLTPAGARLAAGVNALLDQADALRDLVVDIHDDQSPPDLLRVGLLLDGLGPVTASIFGACRTAMLHVAVRTRRVQPHELPSALLSRTVDVVLQHGPSHDDRVTTIPLFTEPRVVVLSRADPLADANILHARDVLDVPARQRRPGIDPTWEGFFTLVDQRNGEQPARRGEPAKSLEELLWSISIEELFLTVPRHLARTYPDDTFGITYVPLTGLPDVQFAVAHRADDSRPHVHEFVRLVQAMAGRPPFPSPLLT